MDLVVINRITEGYSGKKRCRLMPEYMFTRQQKLERRLKQD
jgi:hypothetical protein